MKGRINFFFLSQRNVCWCCCGTLKVKRIRMYFEGETCVKVEKPEKMRTQNNPHKLLLTILSIQGNHRNIFQPLDIAQYRFAVYYTEGTR